MGPACVTTFYRYDPKKEYAQGGWIVAPVEKLTGRSGSAALSFGFGSFTGVAKYCTVGADPNPDNGGHYLYLAVTHTSSCEVFSADPGAGPVKLRGMEDRLRGLSDALEEASARLPKAPDLGDCSSAWLTRLDLEKLLETRQLGLALESGVTVEANFVLSHGRLRLQYVRAVASYVNVSTELHLPIGLSGVNVDLQASYAMSASLFEVPGADTLTYVGTVHNGFNQPRRNSPARRLPLADRDDTGSALWQEYTDRHSERLWKIMCRLADTTTNTHREAVEDFEDCGGPALVARAARFGLRGGASFDKLTYEELLEDLTRMFEAGQREALSELESSWTMVDSEDLAALEALDRERAPEEDVGEEEEEEDEEEEDEEEEDGRRGRGRPRTAVRGGRARRSRASGAALRPRAAALAEPELALLLS